MTRTYPGDLLQVAANGRFYYAIVLDKIRLFGGQLCFVLYRTSDTPLAAADVLKEPLEGFYEIVDFIWAKRENRLKRVTTKLDIAALDRGVPYFKDTYAIKEKAKDWFICDREGQVLRRVQKLTDEEKRYPLHHRSDDIIMVDLVDKRWSPEQDHRI